jgi:tetratricopeptide (TPR) repeat protein
MKKTKIFVLVAAILGMSIPVKSQNTQDSDGLRFYNSGMNEAAIVYFKKITASGQDANSAREKAEAYYYIGNAFINFEMPDSAIVYFNKGIEQDPTYLYNNIGLTGLTLLRQDPKQAEAVFKQAIKLEKKEINVYLAIARAYISQKDYVNAGKYIDRAIKTDSKSGLPYILKGDIALADNKHMDAASQYEQAMYFSSDLMGAYIKYAAIYMLLNKDLAIITLQRAKDELKVNNDDFKGIDALLGEIYFSQGKSSEAVLSYANFINEGNYTETHLLQYALYLYMDKQYDKVMEIINPVLKKEPDNFVANRINAYAKAKMESGDEGLSYIENFVKTAPEDKLIYLDHITLGEELSDNERYFDAIVSFQKAIKLDSNCRYLYQDIADAYSSEKAIDSAAKYYDLYATIAGKDDLTVLFKYGRNLYSMASNLDSTMQEKQIFYLKKADTIFQLFTALAAENYLGYLWRARVNSFIDIETTLGLAKPYYEKLVEVCLPAAGEHKRELSEAYRYLGYYYYVQADLKATANNNNAKAAKEEYLKSKEYFSKVLEVEPGNAIAQQVIEAIDKLNLEK